MSFCNKCETEKPSVDFYKHQLNSKDSGECKECTKDRVRRNRQERLGQYQEYERQRANRPERVALRTAYAKSEKGREAGNRTKRRHSKRNRTKKEATTIVGNAVRDGRLFKPDKCEVCGKNHHRLHGHHDDYSKPLEVRWLCPTCHKKWHRLNGPGLNGGSIRMILQFVTNSGSVATLGTLKILKKSDLKKYVKSNELAWVCF